MKKVLVTLFLFAQLITRAQDVQFFTGTWEEANAKAKAENKLILVDAYTYWCGPCKVMDKTFFHDNVAVADVINKYFVPYKIECEHDFGIVFSRKFKVMGYPSLLYFNADGQLLYRQMGYNPDQQGFIDGLMKVVNMDQKDTYGYDAKQMNLPWPEFYANDYRNANDSTWKRNKTVDPNAWLDQQTDLKSEMSWAVMVRFNLNEKYNNYFLDNYEAYKKSYKEEAKYKVEDVIYSNVKIAADTKNEALLNKSVEDYKRYINSDEANLFYLMSYYYELTNNWKAYADGFEAFMNNKENNVNLNAINNTAWSIYESTEDKDIIEQVAKWFDPYLATMNGYNELDTYAALLARLQQYAEAETWALKAIAAGKSESLDVKATEALLEEIRKHL